MNALSMKLSWTPMYFFFFFAVQNLFLSKSIVMIIIPSIIICKYIPLRSRHGPGPEPLLVESCRGELSNCQIKLCNIIGNLMWCDVLMTPEAVVILCMGDRSNGIST